MGDLDRLNERFAPAVAAVEQVFGCDGVGQPELLAGVGVELEEGLREVDGIGQSAAEGEGGWHIVRWKRRT